MKLKPRFIVPMLVVIAGLVLALGASAFISPKKQQTAPFTGYFYKYKLSVYDESNIRNINNYERSNDACSPGVHVCGVLLPTNQTLGQPPVSGEFSSVEDDLWNSEDAGSAQTPDISMRN